MKTSDLIRTEIRRHQKPGKPVDTDTLIEAFAAVMDMKLSRVAARFSEIEQKLRGDEA